MTSANDQEQRLKMTTGRPTLGSHRHGSHCRTPPDNASSSENLTLRPPKGLSLLQGRGPVFVYASPTKRTLTTCPLNTAIASAFSFPFRPHPSAVFANRLVSAAPTPADRRRWRPFFHSAKPRGLRGEFAALQSAPGGSVRRGEQCCCCIPRCANLPSAPTHSGGKGDVAQCPHDFLRWCAARRPRCVGECMARTVHQERNLSTRGVPGPLPGWHLWAPRSRWAWLGSPAPGQICTRSRPGAHAEDDSPNRKSIHHIWRTTSGRLGAGRRGSGPRPSS